MICSQKDKLSSLIVQLQGEILAKGFTKITVESSIANLALLGHSYDTRSFPALPIDHDWGAAHPDHPQTLAEALLWKMGKWNVYKSFSSHYVNASSTPTETDVVFYGFAKHLKDLNNPIYDQHAIRALWAIDSSLNEDEQRKCRSILLRRDGKWKETTGGRNTIECYNLFTRRISELSKGEDKASKQNIDKLLMPLGQAIKKITDSYTDFAALCAWI
jgi:hypothetical protein